MAVLQQPTASGNVFADAIGDDLAPAGTFAATVIDIRDEFGVQRQKFQSTEMEVVDLTTFLFGFRDGMGFEHRVSSRRMKISGNEKSSLFGFLKSLLGRAPQYGWDYMEMRGARCLLTVEHVQRRDGVGVFAAIAALSPVPAGMDNGPQGMDNRPRTTDYGPQGMGMDHGPRTMDHGPQAGNGSAQPPHQGGPHGAGQARPPVAGAQPMGARPVGPAPMGGAMGRPAAGPAAGQAAGSGQVRPGLVDEPIPF